mgnify:CR=1 FL=1
MIHARIIGTGSYAPKKVLTNHDLEKMVETSDEWIMERTGIRVGFKPAGGISTAKKALAWQSLMKEELGDEWLMPDLFRIGASTLLTDLERQLYHYLTGHYAAQHHMPMG